MRYCVYSSCNKVFSKDFVVKFMSFCIFVLYTIYVLCCTYARKAFTLSNCLIYLFGQHTHYYLFIAPIMIMVLSESINPNAYSTYEVTHFGNTKAYAWMQIGRMIIVSILSVAIFALAATILYLPVCTFSQPWTVFNDLRIQLGYTMISKNLYTLSGCNITLIQLAMTTLSLIAYGLLVLLLKICIHNKILPIIIVLVWNFCVYLICYVDIIPVASWLFPYPHTFINYASSKIALIWNVFYWLVVIGMLISGCLYAMEKRDFISDTDR
jgi:hypothetical protein